MFGSRRKGAEDDMGQFDQLKDRFARVVKVDSSHCVEGEFKLMDKIQKINAMIGEIFI
jgi:hypothetical protein